jgi:hypothetical protein
MLGGRRWRVVVDIPVAISNVGRQANRSGDEAGVFGLALSGNDRRRRLRGVEGNPAIRRVL